jgi:hypothetical protein
MHTNTIHEGKPSLNLAAAQAVLLQDLAAYLAARAALDTARQFAVQRAVDPASTADQRKQADRTFFKFAHDEEHALFLLMSAHRQFLASNSVSEIVLDGQRLQVAS